MDSSTSDGDLRAARPGPPASGRVPPALPAISDYWPDAPHRAGPAPGPQDGGIGQPLEVVRHPSRPVHGRVTETTETVPDEEPRRPRRRFPLALGYALAAVLLAGAGTVLAGLVRGDDRPTAGVVAVPAPETTPPRLASEAPQVPVPVQPAEPTRSAATTASVSPSVSPPVSAAPAPEAATFELRSSLATVTVRSGEVGSELIRVDAPDGVEPRITRTGGSVRLTLTRAGAPVAAPAEVTLDDDVRWSVRLSGGASRGVLDLTGSAPVRLDLAGGGASIDVRLPATRAVLPVRIADGINQLRLRTPAEVPVRVRAREGAGQVTLYGDRRGGVARGGVVATRDDAQERPGIEVEAEEGLGGLTVEA